MNDPMPFLQGDRTKERPFNPIEPLVVPFRKTDRVQLFVILAGLVWCAGYLAGFVR